LSIYFPTQIHYRLPKRFPFSLGFDSYSVEMDGAANDIRVPHSPSLAFTGELTVNVWYRQDAFNLWAGPIGKANGFEIQVDSGGGGVTLSIYYITLQ